MNFEEETDFHSKIYYFKQLTNCVNPGIRIKVKCLHCSCAQRELSKIFTSLKPLSLTSCYLT